MVGGLAGGYDEFVDGMLACTLFALVVDKSFLCRFIDW